MNNDLTKDEVDALAQVSRKEHRTRPSACVARNTKRLTGIKLLEHARDGQLVLTEKGRQALFIHQCIDVLRGLNAGMETSVAADVAAFLCRKGHIAPNESGTGFDITMRGKESLADIDAQAR